MKRELLIVLHRLEGTEEKFRNRESRPEDLQIIAELKDMVTERESLVKKLVVSKLMLKIFSSSLSLRATVIDITGFNALVYISLVVRVG